MRIIAVLAVSLSLPASAQVRLVPLSAPRSPQLASSVHAVAAPSLPSLSVPVLAPSLAPSLPSPAAASALVAEATLSAAPALAAVAAPSASAADSRGAAAASFDALLGVPAAASVPGVPAPVPAAAPAFAPPDIAVKFPRAVPAPPRALLAETLRRRQAGWREGMKSAGVRADAPAPSFAVTKVAEKSAGTPAAETSYEISWSQGPQRVGAFRVTIRHKDLRARFARLAAPEAPKSKVFSVRLLPGIARADAERLLEAAGLRVLGGSGQDWRVAAVGRDTPKAAAARLMKAKDAVFYASPAAKAAPSRLLRVRVLPGATEDELSALFRAARLTVSVAPRPYLAQPDPWLLVASGPVEKALKRLRASGLVLAASPAALKLDEGRQAVVRVKEGVDAVDLAARLNRDWGVDLVAEHGGRSYRVQAPKGVSGAALAARLSADSAVERAVPVGAVSDESVAAAAKGAASYKGRPWSSTEYNMQSYYSRLSLEEAGATRAQLETFERLLAAAPVLGGGFNPWSGD